jgi:hypothetical protein
MGIVVRLKDHARALTGSRAARPVSLSAVKPATIPRSVVKTIAHHSAGMLSRCHHLETAAALAPMSAAIASREGHSSMIDRNDVSAMQIAIRQSVLKSKDILSADLGAVLGQTVLMGTDKPSTSLFKQMFLARTALAREKAGKSQEQMAAELGVAQGTYHKYESRTPLPHHLIPQFCMLTDITPQWLYTAAVEIREAKPRRRRQARSSKAA